MIVSMPCAVGGLAPRSRLLERQIGQDRGRDPGTAELCGESRRPRMVHQVVVRHHGERDVDIEVRHLVEDRTPA